MKITILGGAGTRVPLLTNGLLRFHEDLQTGQLALWDINWDRREVIARISKAMCGRFGIDLDVACPSTLEESLEDADFVISSIRVGGMSGRISDETVALEHDTVGQETVGAGGFCLALRTIPVVVDYVRRVSELAPRAWMLNFTNPVGILSQALIAAGVGDRVIGICDTPREQFETIARVLGEDLEDVFFDYFGLNHLGWIKGVKVKGRDRMTELLSSTEKLRELYRVPFFETEFLQQLKLFPTEYLYFYYRPEHALEQTRKSGKTRGQLIVQLESGMMDAVARLDEPDQVIDAYEDYLARRNASYMAVETGGDLENDVELNRAREELYQHAAGYERIAIDVMRAIRLNRPRVMPVDVANQGAIDEMDESDAVEVLCAIDANGAHPLAVDHVPPQVRELLLRVKRYERMTVRAALQKSAALAEQALAENPLIKDLQQARDLLDEYREVHKPHLDYLQ